MVWFYEYKVWVLWNFTNFENVTFIVLIWIVMLWRKLGGTNYVRKSDGQLPYWFWCELYLQILTKLYIVSWASLIQWEDKESGATTEILETFVSPNPPPLPTFGLLCFFDFTLFFYFVGKRPFIYYLPPIVFAGSRQALSAQYAESFSLIALKLNANRSIYMCCFVHDSLNHLTLLLSWLSVRV